MADCMQLSVVSSGGPLFYAGFASLFLPKEIGFAALSWRGTKLVRDMV